MLFVISPAKSLDFDSAALTDVFTQPQFLEDAKNLVGTMRQYSSEDIMNMMKVSENIADLNVERYQAWSIPFTEQNAKQAIYAFKGDVYTGIAVESAEQPQLDYLQEQVRILSGLYGVLKPLDLMQAYRLEMGTKVENSRGANLYAFWGDKITNFLNDELAAQPQPILVNLASNEYYKSIKAKNINARIVTPVFKDLKNDQYKIISFYAKKARGLMIRYAADHQVSNVEALKDFDYGGYAYNEVLSSDNEWVFTRDKAPE